MVGLALLDSDAYLIIRFVLSIFALIIAVFALQGRKPLWLIPLVAIAVVWNPVVPLEFAGPLWRIAHVFAAGAFLVVALFLRVPDRRPPAMSA